MATVSPLRRALTILIVGLVVVAGSSKIAARAGMPRALDADEVVWWDQYREQQLVRLMRTIPLGEPRLTGELEPTFDTPEPVPSRSTLLGFRWPVRSASQITSSFGYRRNPLNRSQVQFHHGLDIRCSTGEAVRAAHRGLVRGIGSSSVYGTYMLVEHDYGFRTFYGHLSGTRASVGERVSRGEAIASCGATGAVTGAHLHFEVRHGESHYDPLAFLPY